MPKKMAVDTKKKNVVKKLIGTKKEAVKASGKPEGQPGSHMARGKMKAKAAAKGK